MKKRILDETGFIKKYECLYFKSASKEEKKRKIGMAHLVGTSREVEASIFPNDQMVKVKAIKDIHIAWKAGRLTEELINSKGKVFPQNGRGREIKELDDFLTAVNKNTILDESIEDYDKRARNAIRELYRLKFKYNVRNLGSVYILSILFFLSGGEYPVYDKYAHTAVKALYFDKNPKDVFVGEAPQGTPQGKKESDERIREADLDQIMGMYEEYCFLLNEVFGKSAISRELDRALW